jgi:putative Holliday junction resolvase
MRLLAIDFGQRRLGLALSDASAVIARPWRSVPAGATPAQSAGAVAALFAAGDAALDEVRAVVVGLPRRLNGDDTDQTGPAREFAAALRDRLGLEVHLQDERLSSREAESRLARRERDWRRRKQQIDAAAAAVILQDFLDERAARQARDAAGL